MTTNALTNARIGNVGFIGIGAMGWWLAKHIQDLPQVHTCTVWNRTHSKALAHSQKFGTAATSDIESLGKCSMVVSCVSTSNCLFPIVENVAPHLKPQSIWIDCTSGDPNITAQIRDVLSRYNVELVDAPVSGGPRGAQNRALSVIVGAAHHRVFEQVEPVLSSFAKQVSHVGPTGAGHAIKAINNILNVSHLMLASEGLAALTKMGIDPARALHAINASSGRSLMTEQRLPEEVLTRRFGYGFKLGLMKKDVDIAVSVLDSFYEDARLMRLSQQMVGEAEQQFGFDADYTDVVKLMEDAAHTQITTEHAKMNSTGSATKPPAHTNMMNTAVPKTKFFKHE